MLRKYKMNRPRSLRNKKNAKRLADFIRKERCRSSTPFGFVRQPEQTIIPLFQLAGLKPLKTVINDKILQKGKCRVFVISPYKEPGILHLASAFGSDLEITGMDIAKRDKADKLHASKHYIVGNALTKPFPKSDIIFSTFALGYMGEKNIGFLMEKTAHALNSAGLAVLHVNSLGVINKRRALLIKNPAKLMKALSKIKIQNCETSFFEGNENMPGFVIVIKKHSAQEETEEFEKEMEKRYGPWGRGMLD